MAQKKVIEYSRMACIEMFDEADTDEVVAHYEALGKWDDVSIDADGDIILSDFED